MKHISVAAFKEVVEVEHSNPTIDFINVCTPGEFRASNINHVRNVPLQELERHVDEFATKKTIYVHCRSGKRSQLALEKLARLGVTAELVNVEGGLMAWKNAGFEIHSLPTSGMFLKIIITLLVILAFAWWLVIGY